MQLLKLMAEGEEGDERKYSANTHTQHGIITSVGIRQLIGLVGIYLEIWLHSGGISYQGILTGSTSPKKQTLLIIQGWNDSPILLLPLITQIK